MIAFIKKIESLDNPDIYIYLTLKRPKQHREIGLFVVEGDKVVKRFLQSEHTAVSILVTEELFESYRPDIEQKNEQIAVYITTPDLLQKIVGFHYHQGIMAVGVVPQSPLIESVMSRKAENIFVAVDKLESAENTGVIVRNCAAFGVDAFITGETSTDPYLRRSVRNSMGTVFKLPVLYSQSLPKTLKELKETYGFTIIAAHPRQDSVPLFNLEFKGNICIVLGNEGSGICEEVLGICDLMVTIPMISGIDSLNVACANAVMLYEIIRQKNQKPKTIST